MRGWSGLAVSTLTGLSWIAGSKAAEQNIFGAPKFDVIHQPSDEDIAAAAATARTASFKDVPYVAGKAFDRVVIIWLENTDYMKAVGEPHLKALGQQGITLTNYWALTHPSEPNYIASSCGDYFGLASDDFVVVPDEVFTIADLLEEKEVSWAAYQEGMPYTGYLAQVYRDTATGNRPYERKHNPLISFNGTLNDDDRLARIKNFTEFHKDVAAEALPQWMFITPNMTNDGHDSTIRVAGTWAEDFLMPLLENPYFLKDTLVVLTFDEDDSKLQNQVLTLLLGDIPEALKGTEDDTYYDHYSLLSSVQSNWGLSNLGRRDCGANVFDVIADETGYENIKEGSRLRLHAVPKMGYFGSELLPIPSPNLECQGAGGAVLQKIVDVWE